MCLCVYVYVCHKNIKKNKCEMHTLLRNSMIRRFLAELYKIKKGLLFRSDICYGLCHWKTFYKYITTPLLNQNATFVHFLAV